MNKFKTKFKALKEYMNWSNKDIVDITGNGINSVSIMINKDDENYPRWLKLALVLYDKLIDKENELETLKSAQSEYLNSEGKRSTGLKDTNGLIIYEGDWLMDIDSEEELDEDAQPQQVYWDDLDGCFKLDITFAQNNQDGYLLAKELRTFKYRKYQK